MDQTDLGRGEEARQPIQPSIIVWTEFGPRRAYIQSFRYNYHSFPQKAKFFEFCLFGHGSRYEHTSTVDK